MNGTDNILISMLVNVGTVGLCSNYTMVIQAIKSVISSALNGVTASVGNLNAVGDAKQKERVFYVITFANYLVYSFTALAFIVLLNPFIKMWLNESYVLGLEVSIALSVSYFIDGLRNPGYTYRTTLGLFQKGRITPYIGAITNIVCSIVLCKWFGVAGIFFATSIAQLVSYSWIDPYLIHKYEFKTPVIKYFKKFIMYIIIFAVEVLICLELSKLITVDGIKGLILNGVMVCIVPNIINLLVFYRTNEFKELTSKLPVVNKIIK